MLIPCDEVNILNTFRVMIILRLLLLLTNLHLKLLSTQGTGADKLLSTQRVKEHLYNNYILDLTRAWQYFGTLTFELFPEILRTYVDKINFLFLG